MPRPNKSKRVRGLPACSQFVPDDPGDGRCIHRIRMTVEEYETIRLIDYAGCTQEECALHMDVGRGTVQSIYTAARKKMARFLVEASALEICGGDYVISRRAEAGGNGYHIGEGKRGENQMKIAVTYENGEVFQHFGHTEQFKVYQVEDGTIISSEVINTEGSGHGALADFLKAAGVDVLICGGIGMGARNALAEAGIELYPGACGNADHQAEAFLAGSLAYDPDTSCSHHDHHGEDHDCGGHHGHNCSGSCGK